MSHLNIPSKEIFPEMLDRERKKVSKLTFDMLDGSSRFRVMVIEPDSNVVKVIFVFAKCVWIIWGVVLYLKALTSIQPP